MIQCPRCASIVVSEERFIPPPSGELRGWVRILLWPFRMPGMAITTIFAVLLSVGAMFLLSDFYQRTNPDGGLDPGIAICGATALLGLYALGMAKLPQYLVSRVLPSLSHQGSGLSGIPRLYQRICGNCGYRWTWDPMKPSISDIKPGSTVSGPSALDLEAAKPSHREPMAATVVPFHCPDCGHESSYDPWLGPAHCSKCGYSPSPGKSLRRAVKRLRLDRSQPYLQDFLSHWRGEPAGESPFDLSAEVEAVKSFQAYQVALGEDLHPVPGHYYASGYFRRRSPTRLEILSFLDAYRLLRQGERGLAQEALSRLTTNSPDFVEAWMWLAVVTEDPVDRRFCLERASQLEPSHPLLVDIRSILQGQVPIPAGTGALEIGGQLQAQHCPACGGVLHFQAGASEVECGHCGHRVILQSQVRPHPRSHLVSAMRLQRKILRQSWKDIDRILSCQACGAQMTMTESLARSCAFCGSPNVIIGDHETALEQPDSFVPFQIDERSAKKAIQRHRPSMLWDSRGWRTFRALEFEHLLGIYVPFWAFDGLVEPIWTTMQPNGVFSKSSGPGSAYAVEDLILPGSSRPIPSLLDEISAYHLNATVAYEPELLAEWSAMLYDIDIEIAVEDAYDIMITLAQEAMGPPILIGAEAPQGARAVRTLQVAHTTYQLILLPLWVAKMTGDDALALALVNGQTGDSVFRMAYRSRSLPDGASVIRPADGAALGDSKP